MPGRDDIARALVQPPNGSFGELKPYQPSYRENVTDAIGSLLGYLGMDKYAARQNAQGAVGLSEWSPFGMLTAADDAKRAYNAGDYGGAALAAVGAVPMVGKEAKAGEEAIQQGIKAYHGSPHSFDKFDISKVGTGEGNQAYGHGLYFAENEGVAKSYRDALTYGSGSPPGHMYEVGIRADPESLLDYDALLSKQGLPVRSALSKLAADYPPPGGGEYPAHRWFGDTVQRWVSSQSGGMANAAQALKEAGIPGIRYLDQGSRGAGEGTRNYVVFDPGIIDVIKKYGIAGALGAGLISEQEAQLAQQQGLAQGGGDDDNNRDRLARATMGF